MIGDAGGEEKFMRIPQKKAGNGLYRAQVQQIAAKYIPVYYFYMNAGKALVDSGQHNRW